MAGFSAQFPSCGQHGGQRGVEDRGEFFGSASAEDFHVVDIVFAAWVDDPSEHFASFDSDYPDLCRCAQRGERCPSDEFVEFFDGIDWAGECVARRCVGAGCCDNDGVAVCCLAGGRKGARFGCVEFRCLGGFRIHLSSELALGHNCFRVVIRRP